MSQHLLLVLDLAYDGADFRGWQAQPALRTVQGVLQATLSSLLEEEVRVDGAARTDAGVHARGQVAHFAARRGAPAARDLAELCRSLASALPATLQPQRIARAPASFHARASSTAKRYLYRFRWGPGDRDPRSFHLGATASPDWERARAALRGLGGLPELPGIGSPSTDRRPAPALEEWQLADGPSEASFEVRAPAFRKHQVRNLAGHLAAVALGLCSPESLAALARRRRPWMGAVAPPHGLCLEEVVYPALLDPFRAFAVASGTAEPAAIDRRLC
jgi:tRNA pseudouridine38-40 synthase